VLALPLVVGCLNARVDDRYLGPYDQAPFVNAVSPGSELAEGQHYFLNETWGLEQLDRWPPVDFLLQLMEDEPGLFGDQFSRFGLVPDIGDDLPFGLKRGSVDPTRVSETCVACHMAEVDEGRLWAGAPNGRLDLALLRAEVKQRWFAAGNPPLVSPLGEERDEKLRAVGRGREDVGPPAFPFAMPVDIPSLFSLAESTALNGLGTSQDLRTEVWRQLHIRGSGSQALDGTVVLPPSEDKVDALVAFLEELRPSAPPEPGDPASVIRGRTVFQSAGCLGCHVPAEPAVHGTVPYLRAGPELRPGEDDSRPDGSISTSGARRVYLDGLEAEPLPDDADGDLIAKAAALIDDQGIDVAGFWFGVQHGMRVGGTEGYRVPNLTGLWMTSPFLHNGSVRGLRQLLLPAEEREPVWNRNGFEVDTGAWGSSNRGHEFGTELEDGEKNDLVNYLLTL
jgi:mono/diheme cytochrome c family protein